MNDSIIFKKGTSKTDRAAYIVGTKPIPASVVTRLLNDLENLSGAKLDRAFYQGMEKYPEALDVLDGLGMVPAAAVEKFKALQEVNKPAKAGAGKRVSKIVKNAELFSKGICKSFKGTPEEMFTEFLQAVSSDEFKKEVVDIIAAYEKNHGKSGLGFIKTSARKGNLAAQMALAEARAAKKE